MSIPQSHNRILCEGTALNKMTTTCLVRLVAMQWMSPAWLVGTLLLLSGCATLGSREPLPTAASVDLIRYTGTWHEIARLPMWFQRHCVESKAIYAIRPDGRVAVHNECLTDACRLDQADGVATVIDTKTNARLTVTFDNWFARLAGSSREGNYWILDLDEEYHTAMVGTPDRRYLWILCRTPQLDDLTYQRLTLKARALGFPISDLITRKVSQPSH